MLVWLLPCITASLLTLVPLLTTCQRLIISSQHSGPLGLSACRLICSYQVLVVNMEVQVTCSLNLGLSDLPGKMFKHVVSRSSRAAWTLWVHPTQSKLTWCLEEDEQPRADRPSPPCRRWETTDTRTSFCFLYDLFSYYSASSLRASFHIESTDWRLKQK